MKPSIQHRIGWAITTLQEAYTAIVPYFLLISFITLLLAFLRYFDLSVLFLSPTHVARLSNTLNLLSSFVIVISIAYAFSRRFELSSIISITLALAAYATAVTLESPITALLTNESYGFAFQPLVLPILSTWLLHLSYPRFSLKIPLKDSNAHIYRLFNYVPAFGMAYLATTAAYSLSHWLVTVASEHIAIYTDLSLPTLITYALRDLVIQFFWFMGIHGDHTVNALIGKDLLHVEIFPHLSVGEFNRLFVSIGGSGAGLALMLALLKYAKEHTLRLITRISIPFVFFNINTLLIYAVVVFNRFLFVPFLLLPLFNILFSYTYLSLIDVTFTAHKVVWTTPIFLDSYIKAVNPLPLYLLQTALLLINTAVYARFLQLFVQTQSQTNHAETLQHNLDIPYSIRAVQNIKPFIARREIIESNAQLTDVIKDINNENLMIYFQPKVDLRHNHCTHFEALIRYRVDGKIVGPVFLDLIEKARLAHIIDTWVAREVKHALEHWHTMGFEPTININLHPDTLIHTKALDIIIDTLQGERINFEIIERSFIAETKTVESIEKLKAHGFGISIDDYGIGYSNIETIIKYQIDELKIDKAIVDLLEQERGNTVCKHIIQLGKNLDIKIVAEGVESLEQAALLHQMEIDYIQGFYFSQALPFEQVRPYANRFEVRRYLKSA